MPNESIESKIKPEEVFEEILIELNKRNNRGFFYKIFHKGSDEGYPLRLSKLYKAVWEAKGKYPKVMQGFRLEGSEDEPFSYEVGECVLEFRQDGYLKFVSDRGNVLTKKGKDLGRLFERKPEIKEAAKYICDFL
jgi:hypothetical protein